MARTRSTQFRFNLLSSNSTDTGTITNKNRPPKQPRLLPLPISWPEKRSYWYGWRDLEPPRLAPPEPKSGVSTNSTTPARYSAYRASKSSGASITPDMKSAKKKSTSPPYSPNLSWGYRAKFFLFFAFKWLFHPAKRQEIRSRTHTIHKGTIIHQEPSSHQHPPLQAANPPIPYKDQATFQANLQQSAQVRRKALPAHATRQRHMPHPAWASLEPSNRQRSPPTTSPLPAVAR